MGTHNSCDLLTHLQPVSHLWFNMVYQKPITGTFYLYYPKAYHIGVCAWWDGVVGWLDIDHLKISFSQKQDPEAQRTEVELTLSDIGSIRDLQLAFGPCVLKCAWVQIRYRDVFIFHAFLYCNQRKYHNIVHLICVWMQIYWYCVSFFLHCVADSKIYTRPQEHRNRKTFERWFLT